MENNTIRYNGFNFTVARKKKMGFAGKYSAYVDKVVVILVSQQKGKKDDNKRETRITISKPAMAIMGNPAYVDIAYVGGKSPMMMIYPGTEFKVSNQQRSNFATIYSLDVVEALGLDNLSASAALHTVVDNGRLICHTNIRTVIP